jgi:LPXTG-motif cell wall-anchored protein
MFRKLAALVAIATAALFVSAGSASAEYTPTTEQGTTSRSTVTEGGTVVFSYDGGDFVPGTPITISVTYNNNVGGGAGSSGLMLAPRTAVVGTTTADANGNFDTTVELTEPGLATLTASGAARDGGTLNVVTQVRVLAAGSAAGTGGTGGAALPRTGSDIGTQLWIGAGLLALGASLVALTVARKRERVRA